MANRSLLAETPGLVESRRSPNATVAGAKKWFALPVGTIEPAVFAIDLVLIVGASILCGTAYSRLFLGSIGDIQSYFGVGALVFAYCAAFLTSRGGYRIKSLVNFRHQMREVTVAWLSVAFILLSVAFTLKIAETFSRGATLTFFVAGWLSLLIWRNVVAKYLVRSLASGGFAERKAILIGERDQIASSAALTQLRRCGYKSISTFALAEQDMDANGMAQSLRGRLRSVIDIARHESVNDIFLLIAWNRDRCIENILNVLAVLPATVHLVPDRNVARFLTHPMIHIGATWTTALRRAPLTMLECAFKRAADLVLCAGALVLLSPMMMLIAAAIAVDSPGPILFRQTRNGFNGKSFSILKFRSMRVLENGLVIRQATRNDPRVTHVGRLLRRTNLDELPQLFNVLHGDMSLIGPRPHAAAHNSEYERRIATYAFRYHVKPGITGWAQVNGYRGETRTVDLMEKRVELDLWYINNWSMWLDLKILLLTFIRELRPSGY
jgi:Undecaprenyl-phosphate glucose phosphotransferase